MLPLTVNWERSTSAPAPVFGYNTKQIFNPQPTDNIYDDGRFDKINPNVFMGKRTKGNLNFKQYSNNKMWAMPYHDDEDNSAWESNVSWAGNTGMTPSANYQGESVTFSQVSDQQFTSLLMEVGRTNQQVRTNSQNLVQMGNDLTKVGQDNTYFGNSILRLDGVVNDLTSVWQKTVGQVSTNTNAIKTNSDNLIGVGESINQINEDHKNMPKGGGGIFPPILPSLSLTTVALGGLAAYFLLRKK